MAMIFKNLGQFYLNEKENMYYINTDKVDREIEKLKKQQKEIAQKIAQLSSNDGNSEKIKKLKQKLKQLENELSMKDNDSYRRANSEQHS